MSDMQVAIVTGASSGIGFGCATKLAEMGMAVVGTGRDPERLQRLAAAIGDPDRVATLAVDLTDDDAPQRIVDLAVSRGPDRRTGQQRRRRQPQTAARNRRRVPGLLPRRDVAGPVPAGPGRHPAHAIRLGHRQHHLDVRRGRRAARWRLLRGQGGLTALTLHIACQYGPQGIRCNAVAPGVTVTPMVEQRLEDERFRKINTEMTPYPASAPWRTSPPPSRSSVRRAAVSSTARPSSSTAAGARRSTSPSSPLLAVGRPLNLFATLDQAAARFGDRGAVYLGQRRLYTWDQLRDRALRLAGSLRAACHRNPDRGRRREPARARRAVLRGVGRRVRAGSDQLQTASARDGPDPHRLRCRNGVRLAQDRSAPGAHCPGAGGHHRWTRLRNTFRRNAGPRPRHRPGRPGVAVLHQRHHRALQGRHALTTAI